MTSTKEYMRKYREHPLNSTIKPRLNDLEKYRKLVQEYKRRAFEVNSKEMRELVRLERKLVDLKFITLMETYQ